MKVATGDVEIVNAVAELCLILEADAPKAMFSGEIVAQMFSQIISGHSAASVASKRGIESNGAARQLESPTRP